MKLIILLITVSLSANAGWFGNSIEGAFDMKLGEDLSETHIFELQKSYHLAPKYPLNLFNEENYFYRITPEKKVYSISLQASDKDIKCESNSGKFHQLLSILKKKYRDIKLIKKINYGEHHVITTKYSYVDGSRSINLRCSEWSEADGSNLSLEYRDNTTRTRESIL